MSAPAGEATLSVRDELDRRFQGEGRLRRRRWGIAFLVGIVLVIAGFQVYFQNQ